MQKVVYSAFLVLAVSGCASVNVQPIDSKSATSLKNQSVAYTTREKPNFGAMTPSKAAFGMFGVAAMISAGNEIIKENDVSDPANTIVLGLAKTLEEKYEAKIVGTSLPVGTDELIQIASAANGKAKFVLDVQTINWSFIYFPTSWGRYRVIYTAKARLIDADAKTLVAEGFCKRIPETETNAPSYDELLANSAARLKAELSSAAEECINNLKRDMFSVGN